MFRCIHCMARQYCGSMAVAKSAINIANAGKRRGYFHREPLPVIRCRGLRGFSFSDAASRDGGPNHEAGNAASLRPHSPAELARSRKLRASAETRSRRLGLGMAETRSRFRCGQPAGAQADDGAHRIGGDRVDVEDCRRQHRRPLGDFVSPTTRASPPWCSGVPRTPRRSSR